MKEQFQKEGFLIIPNFFEVKQAHQLKKQISKIVRTFSADLQASVFTTDPYHHINDDYFLDSAHEIRFFFEPKAFRQDKKLRYPFEKSLNKIGHALHRLDPVFKDFSHQEKLFFLAKQLDFKKPHIMQSMYIFKQPYFGGEVLCHQDSTFLYTEPNTVTGFWFALEDANQQNGCLWAIPGGHRGPLRSIFMKEGGSKVRFKTLSSLPWNMKDLVPIEAKAGTLVVLHGRLPHLSYENTSSQSRHAYTVHMIDDNAYYPKSNWIPKVEKRDSNSSVYLLNKLAL